MTLNAKIGVFMNIFSILGCETHFKSKLRQNQEMDTEKLRKKFQHLT